MTCSDSSSCDRVAQSPISGAANASMRPRSLKIVVCEPQNLVREALTHLLELCPDTSVVADAAHVEDAIRASRAGEADVLIIDPLQLRVRDFGTCVAMIRYTCPRLLLLGVSGDVRPRRLRHLIKQGLQVCMSKREGRDVLYAALNAAREGEVYMSPTLASLLASSSRRCPPLPPQQSPERNDTLRTGSPVEISSAYNME
jgi:DNA-binding NarL/FixJ family response regulator